MARLTTLGSVGGPVGALGLYSFEDVAAEPVTELDLQPPFGAEWADPARGAEWAEMDRGALWDDPSLTAEWS